MVKILSNICIIATDITFLIICFTFIMNKVYKSLQLGIIRLQLVKMAQLFIISFS